MTTPAGARSGNGYWSVQIGTTGLFGVVLIAMSAFMLLTNSDEAGGAVLLALGGIMFLTTCAWAVDAVTSSTAAQRARFAWAIAQHEGSGLPSNRLSVAEDAVAMRDAALARDDELGPDRIRALQALRPDNPYPDAMPAEGAPAGRPTKGARGPHRTGTALIALFLALTGLYFSCIPPVFILGWPFQLIASMLAVRAIVAAGRGRRLGVTAVVVSILGTLVTFVVMAWRILAG
ncbi:hypothetical protein [Curtobacterium sp. VKM Ac-1393]|uniref:hypothetical protein n=1 Tax=Curtobacterium sp. VKM Ac-1393 TaxID=2783814 RepID=UPI00188C4772|nr:hypothetical protein [Curtobacterium sp. VKM Ac-1393]MBF4608219.1 hypothetical protein [Curtobacterium sp. VKM Ac-1393]